MKQTDAELPVVLQHSSLICSQLQSRLSSLTIEGVVTCILVHSSVKPAGTSMDAEGLQDVLNAGPARFSIAIVSAPLVRSRQVMTPPCG